MAQVDISRIASNIGALNSLQSLNNINKQLSVHQARLASGKRINSAADDPAGLTIGTKLNSRSQGMLVALDNISDAKNLLSVAESGIGSISNIITQMKNKSEQAASDTMGLAERQAVLAQMRAFAAQIDDVMTQTEWNGNKLIDGSYLTTSLTFQTGAGGSDTTTLNGLKNLGATGTTGLKIAYKATADEVIIGTGGADTTDVFSTDAGTSAGSVAGSTKLESGLYSVRFTADATGGGGKAELLNAAGTVLETVTVTTMASASTITFSSYSYTTAAVSTGVTGLAAGSTISANLAITKNGDYSMRVNGNGGQTSPTGAALTTAAQFNSYMTYLDGKLNDVSQQLSLVGAMTGRLTYKEDQVTSAQINLEASYSRIMNANMAEEQVNASKLLILQQTATAMLAQANQAPQFLLSLFR